MTNETMFEFEYHRARIQLPPAVIIQNFLDSVQRQPIELEVFGSNSTPAIGEYWSGQGGIYAGLMRGENGAPDYHLIVPTDNAAYAKEITWGGAGKDEPGAQSDFDGLANTIALCKSKHSHPAAEKMTALTIDGHSDFYLPSRRELRLCWVNVPELFEDGWYWSSTQYSAHHAWCQHFGVGGQSNGGKDDERRARAVRRFINNSVI